MLIAWLLDAANTDYKKTKMDATPALAVLNPVLFLCVPILALSDYIRGIRKGALGVSANSRCSAHVVCSVTPKYASTDLTDARRRVNGCMIHNLQMTSNHPSDNDYAVINP